MAFTQAFQDTDLKLKFQMFIQRYLICPSARRIFSGVTGCDPTSAFNSRSASFIALTFAPLCPEFSLKKLFKQPGPLLKGHHAESGTTQRVV